MDVERLQEALKGGAGACRGEAGGGRIGWRKRCPHAEEGGGQGVFLAAETLLAGRERPWLRAAAALRRGRGSASPRCG